MKHKIALFVTLLAGAGLLLPVSTTPSDEPGVAANFDPQKFMGSYYGIANLPQFFLRDCVGGNMLTYSFNPDKEIDNVVTCTTKDGSLKTTKAQGWIPDPKQPAKWKMIFAPGGLKILGVDYWIIETGPAYQYAAVGNPDRDTLFILSRKMILDKSDYNGLLAKLKAKGFPVEKLVKIEQEKYHKK